MDTPMPDTPAVSASIVIPTFNRLWSLPEAIASCPRGDDVEVIVVDDGSTDGTWDWLQRQPGIRAIRQTNWGKPVAANVGFAAARGEYVRFLDSDDLLIAESVRGQLAFAQARGVDVCVAGYEARYEPSGRRVAHPWHDCGDFLSQQLGECDSSHYSAYFFKRAFLRDIRHRPDFAFRDDRMFVIECAIELPTVAVWDAPTLVHRHHDRQRIQFQPGSTAVVTNWQELRMFKTVYGVMEQRGLLTERRKAAMAWNIWELAKRVGGWNRAEGAAVLAWLRSFLPGFVIPAGGRDRVYAALGYAAAQRVVNVARTGRDAARRLPLVGRGA